MKKLIILVSTFACSFVVADDLDIANKIRSEGFYNSEVMHTLQHLTDKIGPRLSGSPQMKEANNWTLQQLKKMGLKNAHLEGFEFGRGWSHDSASIELTQPRQVSLHGIPPGWTYGTNGRIEGDVVILDAVTKGELENYRGKLAGKIVMMGDQISMKPPSKKVFKRHDSKALKTMKKFDVGRRASHESWITPASRDTYMQRYKFRKVLNAFLKTEKVIGVIYPSRRQGGLINIYGKNHKVGMTFPVPAMVIEAEQYNFLSRLIEDGEKPRIAMNISAQFHDKDTKAYNTIAEIPGSDKNPEVVMLGAHLDSWHASDGAVDNGAGVAVTMEALRILKAIGFEPKRTVRIALWSGEEQGLYGSRAYVAKHFASRPKPDTAEERALPSYLWRSKGWPIKPKKEFEKLSVYFNMDNGSGRFRGIYTEGNVAVKPIFSGWFSPYSDLSAGTVTNKSTGGTDHESFDDVGLPGFQFVQDPLDYSARLHHTHIDSYDHLVENDLKQAAVIMAGFVYKAAMADDRMPRKPMPKLPSSTVLEKKAKAVEKARRKRERDANKAKDTKRYN